VHPGLHLHASIASYPHRIQLHVHPAVRVLKHVVLRAVWRRPASKVACPRGAVADHSDELAVGQPTTRTAVQRDVVGGEAQLGVACAAAGVGHGRLGGVVAQTMTGRRAQRITIEGASCGSGLFERRVRNSNIAPASTRDGASGTHCCHLCSCIIRSSVTGMRLPGAAVQPEGIHEVCVVLARAITRRRRCRLTLVGGLCCRAVKHG
jgi:hypothetical protein